MSAQDLKATILVSPGCFWFFIYALDIFLLFFTAVPCSASLGMENRLIKDAQITASSQWDSNHAAIQARLNFQAGGGKTGAWSARSNDANQRIQVALKSNIKLTGIATQGRNGDSQWVTKYQLQYSDDGVSFHYYKDPGQSSPKVKTYPAYNFQSLHPFTASLSEVSKAS